MGKVEVMQRLVRTASYIDWRSFVKPKIHIIDQRVLVVSSNSSAMKTCLSMATYVVPLALLSYMIVLDTDMFIKHPIQTYVVNDMFSTQIVDYPGVAICNMNIISRKAVTRFVEKIWAQEEVRAIGNMTREKIQRLMKYMGHLISFENDEDMPGDIMLFSHILKVANKTSNIKKTMQRLSPKCKSLMINCFWEGVYYYCSNIIKQHWTADGYCCTFNYLTFSRRRTGRRIIKFITNSERTIYFGERYGLKVRLRSRVDDQFYGILPGNGFKIIIFTSTGYPDAPSGESREVLVSPGSENVLTLKAMSFDSSLAAEEYGNSKRNCLFRLESLETYYGIYSYNRCIMECRTYDIYKNCGCVPFFYPILPKIRKVRKCDFSDLTCLKQNRYKWWSVKPQNTELNKNFDKSEMGNDLNSNLECDCWPSCKSVYYMVSKKSSKIRNFEASYLFSEIQNFTTDDVVLTVTFLANSVVRVIQDAMFDWYDLLGNYGGWCGLFLGISMITPIELLYLFCIRLWSRWRRNHSVQNQPLRAPLAERGLPERPIYWMEIMPTVSM